MPALKIFQNFTTRPFAGDDLQIVCIVLGLYRLIQACCLLPLFISYFVARFSGADLLVNGHGIWCSNYELHNDSSDFLVLTVDEYQNYEITQSKFLSTFVVLACIFLAMDVAWILMVWGAASVGTPTQPGVRDDYLRKLIMLKMFFLNAFPIVLLVVGCLYVHKSRQDNYGCGYDTNGNPYPLVSNPPDQRAIYYLFCVLLVTYSMELLVFPAIATNKLIRLMRANKLTQKKRYETKAKGERLEQCLGGLLKCVSVCIPSQGGKELKNQGEMKDFASNLMEFANNEAKTDCVLSDMYVGGKLLARVQAERRIEGIMKIQRTSNIKKDEKEEEIAASKSNETSPSSTINRRAQLGSQDVRRRRSILTLQAGDDGKDCVVVAKDVLASDNDKDVETLRNAAHYSIYAQYVYFHFHMTLESLIAEDATSFVRDFDLLGPVDKFSLAMWDLPHAHIHYANFYNGIAATPYAILVDDEEEAVVITIRGTHSLEDWVIDLQYVPQPLDKVGELCGFDGKGHHCHKGVLTRCKWTYNDIKKHGVLKHLYSNMSPYKDYKLVVCGHSLGGGCAQVMSLMLRPSFPTLRCFAFEPPGCIFDDLLAEKCKEWITSIVRHEDVVPRVTQPNLETLRDEFFDVVARIKVPKSKAFHDVRAKCPESHLASRNAKVMNPKSEIEPDTDFYQKVLQFRRERAAKNQESAVSKKLYIPGNIVYLVDTTGDGTKYVPYWASRYEFNQVILSGRMLSDHSMPPLVDILRTIKLDDVHEVQTWHTPEEVEEDIAEVRLVMPCSNPQGKVPLLLIFFAVVGAVMSSYSNHGCDYVRRSTIIYPADGGDEGYPGVGLNAGLWSYNLKQCLEGATCDYNPDEPYGTEENLVNSGYCQPYTSNVLTPNIFWTVARGMGSLSTLLGVIGIGLMSVSTCTKIKRRMWIIICVTYLLATLSQGLQFLFFKSDLCTMLTVESTDDKSQSVEFIESSCSLSTDGRVAISATVFWWIIAIGCSVMAKKSSK